MKKTEEKYRELGKLGKQLGIPIFEAFLKLEVFDKDGKLIHKHKQRSHSWVRNAYNHLFCQLAGKNADDSTFGAGLLSIKETGGVIKYSSSFAYGGFSETSSSDDAHAEDASKTGYRATADNDEAGILIGTGTDAESFEGFALQTKIVTGTSAGQMSYIQSEAHAITYTAGTKVLKNDLIRYFNNNSGGSIGVNEVALVGRVRGGVGGTYTYSNVLQARDLLGATVTVADTGQLKVTYTISLTYPA